MIIATTVGSSSPSMRLGISGLPAATASLSVLRLDAGSSLLDAVSVRGASGALVGTTAEVVDFDLPTGRPGVYRVTALASDGSTLEVEDAGYAAYPDPGGSLCWISDPLDQGSAMKAAMLVGTDLERSYRADVDLVYPAGLRRARGRVGDRRASSVQVVLCSRSSEESRKLSSLIEEAPVLLFRPPSHMRVGGAIYGVTPEVVNVPFQESRDPRSPHSGHEHWSFELVQTVPPGRPALGILWTYADVLALGLTYRQLFTAWGLPSGSFGSYRDVLRGL